MKKIVFMLMAIFVLVSLTGCNSNTTVSKPTPKPTPTLTPTPTLSAEQKKYNEIKQGVIKQFESTVDNNFDTSKLPESKLKDFIEMREIYINHITDEIYAYAQDKVTKDECDSKVNQYLEAYFFLAGALTQN